MDPPSQVSGSGSTAASQARNKVYTNDDVVQVIATTHNQDIWAFFDMCHMNDGVKKARCKRCEKSSGTSHGGQNLQMNLFNTLFEDSTKRQRTSAPSSELGQYKALNIMRSLTLEEFQNFDILGWWKEREVQFPIIGDMDRDLLAVQASTVASESAFSASGRIILERRSKLTPEFVEVCVCLKDYLDGVERVQNETSLEGAFLDGVEESIEEEEVEAGLSPPTTELDEGEFEDFEEEEEEDLWGGITGSGV